MLQRADLLLYHAKPPDLAGSRRTQPLHPRQRIAIQAAETFETLFNSNALAPFNAEVSYRQRSVFRETYTRWIMDYVTPGGGSTWEHLYRRYPIVPTAQRHRDRRTVAKAPGVATAGAHATIAWAASNCFSWSGRDTYVKQLLDGVDVACMGGCMNNLPIEERSWDRTRQNEEMRKFKFYLAFENNRCEDYVTEKFYLALYRGLVPVVLGAPNIAQHAPGPKSYIDVNDFATPAALAAHLLALDADDAAYEEYHAWRRRPLSTYGAVLQHDLRELLPVREISDSDREWMTCTMCRALAREEATPRVPLGPVEPFVCLPAWGT
jgi:hypothetical protein